MSIFVLIHGAWHGAWCWERLVPELESRGHRVLTVDLPSDDVAASFDDYAPVVCAALDGVPGDELTVVGHSLAGHMIPLVAARRPVLRLVYLCALLPLPGITFLQQMSDDAGMLDPGYVRGLSSPDPDRRAWADRELAWVHLFGDCDADTANRAIDRLRPQAVHPYRIPCSLEVLPPVDSTYVLCKDDRMVNPDWSRHAARERLGVEPLELAGSHSPFLSRPAELAALLDTL